MTFSKVFPFTSPQSLHEMNSVVCILQIECALFPGVAWQLLSVAFSFTSARILALAFCPNPPRKWLSTVSHMFRTTKTEIGLVFEVQSHYF